MTVGLSLCFDTIYEFIREVETRSAPSFSRRMPFGSATRSPMGVFPPTAYGYPTFSCPIKRSLPMRSLWLSQKKMGVLFCKPGRALHCSQKSVRPASMCTERGAHSSLIFPRPKFVLNVNALTMGLPSLTKDTAWPPAFRRGEWPGVTNAASPSTYRRHRAIWDEMRGGRSRWCYTTAKQLPECK